VEIIFKPRVAQRALKVFLLKESDLAGLPKWAPGKIVPAWYLREDTAVSLRWVSQQLGMGHYARVTQAISRVHRRPGGKVKELKKKLPEN